MTRREIDNTDEALHRLAAGDSIAYSQDGELGWFTDGDRALVSDRAVWALRNGGLITRVCLDDENYRGMSERDVISEAGRASLTKAEAP
jgi:hypothetical protein